MQRKNCLSRRTHSWHSWQDFVNGIASPWYTCPGSELCTRESKHAPHTWVYSLDNGDPVVVECGGVSRSNQSIADRRQAMHETAKSLLGLGVQPADEPELEIEGEPADKPERLKVLDAAAAAIVGQRQQDYGPPEANFTRIAALWSAQLSDRLSAPLTAADVAELMVLLKVARCASGQPTLDTFVDMAGYAALAHELRQR